MDLNTRLHNVAVVGAAGKMGSGIALLLARELAFRALEQPGESWVLQLVDRDDRALQGLQRYLREQGTKEAERQAGRLRQLYRDRPDLVENGEMIQEFVAELMRHVRVSTTLEPLGEALMVFEAVFEREDIKKAVYDHLAAHCPPETFFFTNTSSIPLHVLAEQSGLQGRLIGFHFYNPPAVQKLLEIITPDRCDEALRDLALEVAALLGKQVVPARDIAGFIGNGYFMRDGLYALRTVERLAPELGYVQAVYVVDRVSRDFLLRPMGMFQLIDYVGIDVFQLILAVMDRYLDEELHSPRVDACLAAGIRGGQTALGAPKDGFLAYEKGRVAGILDPATGAYVPLEAAGTRDLDARLGPLPDPALSWKALQGDPEQAAKLAAHFAALRMMDTLGARLALEHLAAHRASALGLVAQGVAHSAEDVNRILTLGFFHLYGPVNPYLD